MIPSVVTRSSKKSAFVNPEGRKRASNKLYGKMVQSRGLIIPGVVCGVKVGAVSGRLYWHLPSQTLFYHFNGGGSEREAGKQEGGITRLHPVWGSTPTLQLTLAILYKITLVTVVSGWRRCRRFIRSPDGVDFVREDEPL